MRNISFIAVIAMVAMMVSCKSGVASIDNQTFAITELNGTALPGSEMAKPSIMFQDGRVSATVGCNTIGGEYKADADGNITITQGMMTKMFCPEEMREDEFLTAFNKVAKYTVDDGEVSFLDAQGNLLFKAKK